VLAIRVAQGCFADEEGSKALSPKAYLKVLVVGPTRELADQVYEESQKSTWQAGPTLRLGNVKDACLDVFSSGVISR